MDLTDQLRTLCNLKAHLLNLYDDWINLLLLTTHTGKGLVLSDDCLLLL